ncbi:hypothetical protein A6A07_09690 [Streptomyces sp. CB03911]|nr:hypothetical protein A6A07_09690 [Streptomyces sp. CB03911]
MDDQVLAAFGQRSATDPPEGRVRRGLAWNSGQTGRGQFLAFDDQTKLLQFGRHRRLLPAQVVQIQAMALEDPEGACRLLRDMCEIPLRQAQYLQTCAA